MLVGVRASFRAHSATASLLAQQCHERGVEPRHIAGFRASVMVGAVI